MRRNIVARTRGSSPESVPTTGIRLWNAGFAAAGECGRRAATQERGTLSVKPGWLKLCWFCPSASTTAKVGRHPSICHPERSRGICGAPLHQATPQPLKLSPFGVAWRERELQIPRLPPDFLSGVVVSADFMRLSSKKAAYVVVDESSVVGNPEFARDDKLKGGGPPWQWWRRRDRVKQQGPHLPKS